MNKVHYSIEEESIQLSLYGKGKKDCQRYISANSEKEKEDIVKDIVLNRWMDYLEGDIEPYSTVSSLEEARELACDNISHSYDCYSRTLTIVNPLITREVIDEDGEVIDSDIVDDGIRIKYSK